MFGVSVFRLFDGGRRLIGALFLFGKNARLVPLRRCF